MPFKDGAEHPSSPRHGGDTDDIDLGLIVREANLWRAKDVLASGPAHQPDLSELGGVNFTHQVTRRFVQLATFQAEEVAERGVRQHDADRGGAQTGDVDESVGPATPMPSASRTRW
jgi:hypothetical protein